MSLRQTLRTKKRMYLAERRAEKKIKDKRRCENRPLTRGSSQPTSAEVFSNSQGSSAGDYAARKDANPPRRQGPCFKISV